MRIESSTFEAKLSNESDRACIILGAAALNEQLGRLLQRGLKGDQRELLQTGGPLGAFPTRIQLTHGLGWITDAVRDDLAAVLAIMEGLPYDDQQPPFASAIVSERCGALQVAEGVLGSGQQDGLELHDGMSALAAPLGEVAAKVARRRFEVTVELLGRQLEALPASA